MPDTMKNIFDTFQNLVPKEYRQDIKPIADNEYEQQQCNWYNESSGILTGYDCGECKNRGYFQYIDEDGNRRMRECKCMANRRYITAMKAAGLGELYEKCTFDAYAVSNDWQRTCKTLAMRYVQQAGNGWFYFGGNSGSGKTHLCTAICSELAKKGRQILYVQWKRYLAQLTQTKFKLYEQERLIESASFADVLYIDDFLKTPHNAPPSEESLSYALEIVDTRYNAGKKTIFSSEFMTKEILRFDEALGSRIVEMSKGNKVLLEREKGRNYRVKDEKQ